MPLDLYMSGSLGGPPYRARYNALCPNRLFSLHPQYVPMFRSYLKVVFEHRDTTTMYLMLDSGAFTQWKKKQPDIDVKILLSLYKKVYKYCQGKFKDIYFISLDKIPGKPGQTATHEEIKEAIRISDENHHILSSEFGDRILPVFHQSEPLSRLWEILALNNNYVCISPRNDVREIYRREWAQRVHELIPGVKTHGLAATSASLMLEVPWGSVDSATVIYAAAYGNILIPYNDNIMNISVSKQSPNRRHFGYHLDTISGEVVEIVNQLCDTVKITRAQLTTDGGARELINAYVLSEAAAKKTKEVLIPQTLFAL